LLGRELDDHFRRASKHGLKVSTTTNGYWAVTEKSARERMERAADAGLGDITLSTGEMHAKFVPPERIVHAAAAAFDLGMQVHVAIEDFADTTFDWRWIVDAREIRERTPDPRLELFRRSWIPHADGVGRAVLRHSADDRRFRPDPVPGCGFIFDDLTVTPDLSLAACCGYPIESIPDLHLGSVANKTIQEVVEEAPDDFLKVMLHVAGPELILEFVKRFIPNYVLPVENVHMCQTCLHLHRDPVALTIVNEHRAEIESRIWELFDRKRARPTNHDRMAGAAG
jgi:hypothetical protein